MKKCIILLFLFPLFLDAQSIGGFSLAIILPSGEFSDTHAAGVGFYGNFEHQFTEKFAFVAETGGASWTALDEETNEYVEQDINTISVMAGANYKFLGPLYAEGRAGYYFRDLNKFALIPAVGLRLGRFDVNLGANVIDPYPFLNLRVGFFWLD